MKSPSKGKLFTKQSTQQWVERAEEDWEVAVPQARALKKPHYNLACNLAQQCAEKYLKAGLEEAGIPILKTHDLIKLLNLILPVEPAWKVLQQDSSSLNAFAVEYRYPGVAATRAMALDAIKSCRHVRNVIRTSFGLPV